MSKLAKTIELMKEMWMSPRDAFHRGQRCPFLLACKFASEPANVQRLPPNIPDDVREFWLVARSASLFKDEKYGQWGMEILPPEQAVNETSRQMASRARDFKNSDLVLARFFGDSDLVVIACDAKHPDFGSVTIALPIDKRNEWPVVAQSFGDFLEKLTEAQGDKYWEVIQ